MGTTDENTSSRQSTTMSHLKWINPGSGEQLYLLSAAEILVGRKSDADVRLTSPYISRHHAKLVRSNEGYSIVDLSNTHSTYVNGQQVQQQKLRHGDRICLGQDRVELRYLTQSDDPAIDVSEGADELEKSFTKLSLILPSNSSHNTDLEKISSLLEFQYQWEKTFSEEKTFEQILRAALKISGAERGYILLKGEDKFQYVSGLGESGERLSESDFQTSQSVARQVAKNGKPVYPAKEIIGEFAMQQSIVNLQLRSLACMPLRWLSPESDTPAVNGVLYLDSTQSMRALSLLDQKILDRLAIEAGTLFEKLELIKTFEKRKSLELELALAQNELQAADALRRAEAKVLLSEYGASMGRFAAALSHELNSPIGALRSVLQSSNALAAKKTGLSAERRNELEELEGTLRRTAIESVERLHQIVLRMQRFTNLDRNEILPVDLNSLLQDVVDILKAGLKDDVCLELNFQPLPSILLRPQQISAVFSNLLNSATEGKNCGGHVSLTTRQIHSHVEVTVEDQSKGMSAEELANIFDPAFKTRGGRVSTGNWGLFSSRQIVREHGGDIEIESIEGKGTKVRVTLPLSEVE
jgi:signal transduction histidine kinase/pSer/pThr/pTyr-binding forkhead associated (FHA) protein